MKLDRKDILKALEKITGAGRRKKHGRKWRSAKYNDIRR